MQIRNSEEELTTKELINKLSKEAAEAANVRRTVVCSSVAAYNISAENPPRYLPVDVDHPAAPITAYGLSKQTGEVSREVLPSAAPWRFAASARPW